MGQRDQPLGVLGRGRDLSVRDQFSIGEQGVEIVRLWLLAKGAVLEGRHVVIEKGRKAVHLQRTLGDMLIQSSRNRELVCVEVKTERRWTGNIFLETWSNLSGEEGRLKPGWLCTLDSDWIAFLFLDTGALYLCDFGELKEWALPERVFAYPEREQRQHAQLNRTVGHIVPIADLGAVLTSWRAYRVPDALLRKDAA